MFLFFILWNMEVFDKNKPRQQDCSTDKLRECDSDKGTRGGSKYPEILRTSF